MAATAAVFPSFTLNLRPSPIHSHYLPSPPPPPYPLLLSFSAGSRTTRFQGPSLPARSPPHLLRPHVWTSSLASAADDVLVAPPSDAAAGSVADTSSQVPQQLVSNSTPDGGVSNVISLLLFVAFVGLSILTVGVIYIAVTDFLQKRESKKFEEEEAAKKKKGGKKRKVKARAGPRGFGQKPVEEEEEASED